VSEPAPRGTVLAVVSDLLLRQKVVEGLRAAGYDAQVAGGPSVMRDKLAAQRPVAMLIDLENRGTDVVEMIADLKAGDATSDIPLLGFFGHVNVDIRTRALAAGCDKVATRGEVASRLDRLMAQLLPA
jgi:DNA-binding response OmpR family regulator